MSTATTRTYTNTEQTWSARSRMKHMSTPGADKNQASGSDTNQEAANSQTNSPGAGAPPPNLPPNDPTPPQGPNIPKELAKARVNPFAKLGKNQLDHKLIKCTEAYVDHIRLKDDEAKAKSFNNIKLLLKMKADPSVSLNYATCLAVRHNLREVLELFDGLEGVNFSTNSDIVAEGITGRDCDKDNVGLVKFLINSPSEPDIGFLNNDLYSGRLAQSGALKTIEYLWREADFRFDGFSLPMFIAMIADNRDNPKNFNVLFKFKELGMDFSAPSHLWSTNPAGVNPEDYQLDRLFINELNSDSTKPICLSNIDLSEVEKIITEYNAAAADPTNTEITEPIKPESYKRINIEGAYGNPAFIGFLKTNGVQGEPSVEAIDRWFKEKYKNGKVKSIRFDYTDFENFRQFLPSWIYGSNNARMVNLQDAYSSKCDDRIFQHLLRAGASGSPQWSAVDDVGNRKAERQGFTS